MNCLFLKFNMKFVSKSSIVSSDCDLFMFHFVGTCSWPFSSLSSPSPRLWSSRLLTWSALPSTTAPSSSPIVSVATLPGQLLRAMPTPPFLQLSSTSLPPCRHPHLRSARPDHFLRSVRISDDYRSRFCTQLCFAYGAQDAYGQNRINCALY